MLQVYCTGPPYEIGYSHGLAAASQILSSLNFYASLFKSSSHMEWSEVCGVALKFLHYLESKHLDLVEEMKGVADGAHVPFVSILALNVRTELAYGMAQSDGCTALAWSRTPSSSSSSSSSFLAQNWDWQRKQKANLIALRIRQTRHDDAIEMQMITEAGIIGKIGMNSAGVGVCLNAIRARGVRFDGLPCHLALRRCLEARSRADAVAAVERDGVASACHILVADGVVGGLGLECSAWSVVRVEQESGVVVHSNHFVLPHCDEVRESGTWRDSPVRLARIRELVGKEREAGRGPTLEGIREMLKDEQGYPTSINRHETDESTVATLFTIVMNLKKGMANVTLGRPTEIEESLELDPKKA